MSTSALGDAFVACRSDSSDRKRRGSGASPDAPPHLEVLALRRPPFPEKALVMISMGLRPANDYRPSNQANGEGPRRSPPPCRPRAAVTKRGALLAGVSRLKLVSNGKNEDDVFGREPTVLRDIPVTAAREDELAPTLFS
jgi:hypothetical protein